MDAKSSALYLKLIFSALAGSIDVTRSLSVVERCRFLRDWRLKLDIEWFYDYLLYLSEGSAFSTESVIVGVKDSPIISTSSDV